jgi:hemolysin activation/secretion protein
MMLQYSALGRLGLRITFLGVTAAACVFPCQAQDNSQPGTVTPHPIEITEYFVEGNTTLSDPEIERAVYPYLGPDKTLDDVEKARVALQKAYETKGLKTVSVEIPQQNVVGGRVRLAVTEARIGQVAVTGARHTSEHRVAAALPAVAPGQVPDLDQFGKELALLNSRSDDRRVTPELKAGAQPGTVDVALNVDDKLPLHGGLEVSNRYSRDTSKTRVQANLRYDNLWGRGHSLSAFYAVAPERRKDSEVYVAAYGAPLTDSLRLDLTGLVSNSDVASVGGINVLGNGHSVTAALSKTLGGPPGLYQRASLTVAYKDFAEDIRFGDSIGHAPITYFPVSLGYSATLIRDGSELGFGTSFTFAFRGLGSDSVQFENKRYQATGGFAYVKADAHYRRDLPKGAELYLALDGQLATEPLVSNEEIAAGGAGSVRGYLQSAAIGDNGLAGTIELRLPSLASALGGVFDELRPIGFIDGAGIWPKYPTPEEQRSFGLIGVGAGLRAKLFGHVSGDFDVAWPMRSVGATRAGDPRIHFRLATDF